MKQDHQELVLPAGVVTFLLTDIQGSTRLWESTAERMAAAVRQHHALVGSLISEFGGVRPRDQGEGDSFLAVFAKATDAAACACAIQLQIASQAWPEGVDIKVRMALHSGEPDLRDSQNYMGSVVNRAARIRALAAGGQILLSGSTAALLQDHVPEGARVESLGTFRLRDLSRAETIFELRYPSAPAFPPLKGAEPMLKNMPVWLSTFVERPEEAAQIAKAISSSRLVTVAGPGGSGKTRLALDVASQLVTDFTDGVWIVDLAPVSDRDLVLHKVAHTLQLVGAVDESISTAGDQVPTFWLREAVISFLSDRELLLVLDNCEHLVEPVAELIEALIAAAPGLHILTTTRELLGIAGESLYRMPPMSVPGSAGSAQEVGEHAAVKLFLERARQVRPSLVLDDRNAAEIAEICRRLDGLPLAIELAAAKVKVMSISDIAERLNDHFRLLTGGSRTAMERQQTLRGAIEWSYQLCEPDERLLLHRLSVFAGGCSLEAAEYVGSDTSRDGADMLEALSGLVDKSMLMTEEAGSQTRYRMLETIRQFASEKLSVSDDSEAVRRRHAEFFLGLAESGDHPIHCADEPEAFDRLDADQQNLHSAVEWCLASGDLETACRFSWALYLYWIGRGMIVEADRWVRAALADPEAVSVGARSGATAALSRISEFMGDPEALEIGRRAIELADRSGISEHGFLANYSALYALAQKGSGDETAAEIDLLLERTYEAARETGKPHLEAIARLANAWILEDRGQFDERTSLLEQNLAFCRRLAFKRGIVMSLAGLASERAASDQLDRALGEAEEAVHLARQLRIIPMEATAWRSLSMVHLARGELEEAREAMVEFVDVIDRSAIALDKAMARGMLAYLDVERGVTEGAAEAIDTYVEAARSWAMPSAIIESLRARARLALEEGRYGEAVDDLERAFGLAQTNPGWLISTASLFAVAKALAGDYSAAREAISEGLSAAMEAGELGAVPSILDCAAYLEAVHGAPEMAARLMGSAGAMRARSGRGTPSLIARLRGAASEGATRAIGQERFDELYLGAEATPLEEVVEAVIGAR